MIKGVKVLDQAHGDNWSLYNGDSVEVIQGIPDRSVGFSVYSPPFSNLYTYSDSERDMGNSADDDEFMKHYAFIAKELLRITRPGRLCAVHCKDLVDYTGRDGRAGLRDFPGELIRVHEAAGWKYHSRVTIWKCPVTEMQRTKSHGLLYKQLRADSTFSRQGLAEYVLVFRRWAAEGEEIEPVTHTFDDFPVEQWQKWASPVWMDIQQTNVLNVAVAREDQDEKHMCLGVGSLVLTREHGYLEIEEVEPGDHVLTHKGRWKRVLAKKCNGVRDVVRVSAQGVPGLVVTPDHRFWTKVPTNKGQEKSSARTAAPQWVEAAQTLSSYLNLPLPPTEESALTKHEWWIVGRWLGDGHRTRPRTSGKRDALGQFIISCGHHEHKELLSTLGDNAGHAASRGTVTQVALVNLRKEVREVLSRCGVGAAEKRLPAEAFALDAEHADALLRGYLSADGHWVERYDRTAASSISRALLLGMAMLAQRARSVVASVYPGRPAREGVIQGRLVKMSQDWIMTFRNSEGFAKSGWIAEDGAWKKVRKIEDAGEEEVWDLQVEDDESFVAEGAVVHNCPLQLDLIERCIKLWSNPGDVVFSPFGGIGSEPLTAIRCGRKAVAIELKPAYFQRAVRNLQDETRQGDLFSGFA